jgi:hypothetical protein
MAADIARVAHDEPDVDLLVGLLIRVPTGNVVHGASRFERFLLHRRVDADPGTNLLRKIRESLAEFGRSDARGVETVGVNAFPVCQRSDECNGDRDGNVETQHGEAQSIGVRIEAPVGRGEAVKT